MAQPPPEITTNAQAATGQPGQAQLANEALRAGGLYSQGQAGSDRNAPAAQSDHDDSDQGPSPLHQAGWGVQAPFSKPESDKSDISIDQAHFDRLGKVAADALNQAGIDQVSLHTEAGTDEVLVERQKPSEIETPAAGDCKKVMLDQEIRASVNRGADGSIDISDISGVSAQVDPGKDPLFGRQLPLVTADLDEVHLSRNPDGTATLSIVGEWYHIKHTQKMPISAKELAQLDAIIKMANKLRDDPNSDKLSHNKPDLQSFKHPPASSNNVEALIATVVTVASAWYIRAVRAQNTARERELMSRDSTAPARVTYLDGKPIADGTVLGGTNGESRARISIDDAGKVRVQLLDPAGVMYISDRLRNVRKITADQTPVDLKPGDGSEKGDSISLGGAGFIQLDQRVESQYKLLCDSPTQFVKGVDRTPPLNRERDLRIVSDDMNGVRCGLDARGLYVSNGELVPGSNEVVASALPITVNGESVSVGGKRYLRPTDKVEVGEKGGRDYAQLSVKAGDPPQEISQRDKGNAGFGDVIRVGDKDGAKLAPGREVVLCQHGDLNPGGDSMADRHAAVRIDSNGNPFMKILPQSDGREVGGWLRKNDGSEEPIKVKDGWVPLGIGDEVSIGGSKFFRLSPEHIETATPYLAGAPLSIPEGKGLRIEADGSIREGSLVPRGGDAPPQVYRSPDGELLIAGSNVTRVRINGHDLTADDVFRLNPNDVVTVDPSRTHQYVRAFDVQPTSYPGKPVDDSGHVSKISLRIAETVNCQGRPRQIAALSPETNTALLTEPGGQVENAQNIGWRKTGDSETAEWLAENYKETAFRESDPCCGLFLDKSGHVVEVEFPGVQGKRLPQPLRLRNRPDLMVLPTTWSGLSELAPVDHVLPAARRGQSAQDKAPAASDQAAQERAPVRSSNELNAKVVGELDGRPVLMQGERGSEYSNTMKLSPTDLLGLGKPGSDFERVEVTLSGKTEVYFHRLGSSEFYLPPENRNGQPTMVQDFEIYLGSAPKATPSANGSAGADSLMLAGKTVPPTAVADLLARVSGSMADLQRSDVLAGMRLRNTLSDVLHDAGLDDRSLAKEQLTFQFSDKVKEPTYRFATGEGANQVQVFKHGAGFVKATDGQLVPKDAVRAQVVLPNALLSGSPQDLARAVLTAAMERASGAKLTPGQAKVLADAVTQADADRLPVAAEASVSTSGLDHSRLPDAVDKAVPVTVEPQGVRVGGVEQTFSFEEIWTKRVDDLNKKLVDAQNRKDERAAGELQNQLLREQALLLRLNDPHQHDAAVAEAEARMRSFMASEKEIADTRARENLEDGTRGRAVAVMILIQAAL